MSTVTSMNRGDAFIVFWRERLECALRAVVGPVAGFALFVLVWQVVAMRIPEIPAPGVTWRAAVELFSDPFYDNGPNDKGIGWNLLASLQRVAVGFGLAALIGIPAGFVIGRYAAARAMFSPIVSLLRPVSPLAWLPLGLLLFKAANPAAIWAIFICSIWPLGGSPKSKGVSPAVRHDPTPWSKNIVPLALFVRKSRRRRCGTA